MQNLNTKELRPFIKSNIPFLILLCILNLSVYFVMLFNNFVSADDLAGYVNNEALKNFGASIKTFTIGATVFSIFKNTVGNSPFPLHLHSLLLHMAVTLLVFILVYILFGKKAAAISSVLFAVHPVNTEVLSWISATGYFYNTIFILTSIIFYLLYRDRGNRKYLVISLTALIAGLILTRSPWILAVPPMLAVMELFIFNKSFKLKSLFPTIPYFGVIIVAAIFFFTSLAFSRVTELHNVYNLNPATATPWLNHLPFSIFMTFKLLAFPKDLSIFHEGQVLSLGFYRFMVFFSLALIPLYVVLIKKSRTAAGLITLIFVAMFPVFSPIQVAFFIAERYLYVPSIFFCILIALILIKIDTKFRNFALIATLILLIIYSARSITRTIDWKDSRHLWEASAQTDPFSARVFNNLGDAYMNEKKYDLSVKAFSRAIEIDPNFTDAVHNLGSTYMQMGAYDLAAQQYEKALQMNPNYVGADRAKQILQVLRERNLIKD
ncbi:MAG: tetratricopeptide repeat protein [Candidatus Gracilibacteria bacterium]|jgi:hypothetical protein